MVENEKDVTGKADESKQPVGVNIPSTPEEWAAVGTVVKAGVDAARSVMDLAKGRRNQAAHPLEVCILRSEPGQGFYVLEFSLRNSLEHGLYVESLDLIEPGGSPTRIRLLEYSVEEGPEERKPVGVSVKAPGGSKLKTATCLPKPIGPDKALQLIVKVPPDSKSWFDQAKLGIARVAITILSSEEESQSVEWAFRIRHL